MLTCPVTCLSPQTRLNRHTSPHNRETSGYGRIQTKTAEFKGPKLGPEKCLCHWPTTVAQFAVSFCCPVPVIDGWRWTSEEILRSFGVDARALPNHTWSAFAKPCMPLSMRMCSNECVGTLRSSGGRMPFPHPSLPIISRPDKTPVCWRIKQWWAGSSLHTTLQMPGGCPWVECWAVCSMHLEGN